MHTTATILIVDDEVTQRSFLCKELERLGFVADSAIDGKEALELINQSSYRLILIDLEMPDMSGYDATIAIRLLEKDQDREAVPIIAVSSEPSRQRCIEAGMSDCYTKPLTPEQLVALLERWHR